jgi:hypothetical protein
MKPGGLWQKLSIDWPCAVTDWLHANTAVPLRASLKQLTLRKIILTVAFMVAAMAFAQIAAGEIVLLMAGDLAAYVEIASLFYLLVARNQLGQAFTLVRQRARQLLPRVRITARSKRLPRRPRLIDSGDSGDEPDGAFAFA